MKVTNCKTGVDNYIFKCSACNDGYKLDSTNAGTA